MINLKKKPFYLTNEEIEWVNKTYDEMTLEERIGQLFVLLKATPGVNEEEIKSLTHQTFLGGLRWQNQDALGALTQANCFQKYSKVPLLIAANCDEGGNGVAPNGTFVATQAECGASNNPKHAYNLGYVAAKEASAVGANWLFNPVIDIYMNWRNTIVNTRSFSGDVDKVINNARSYIKGVKDANPSMAVTLKHFPGDGVDELDQHLSFSINSLSIDEWEKTFGKAYKTLIEEGAEAIMVGHIALPEMSKKLIPGLRDDEIMPATLAKELLNDLLRKELGFNGVTITDASHMGGIVSIRKRSEYVPGAIIAGCDMFLFANDPFEDMNFVKDAYLKGELTEERLSDAVHRILGLKAKLKLYMEEYRYKNKEGLSVFESNEHKKYKIDAAEDAITLVKDTRNYLPINPQNKKRCFLVYLGNLPSSKSFKEDPVKKVLIEELENAGFIVDSCPNFHELEVKNGPSFMNNVIMMTNDSREKFIKEHDFALVVINIKGYAQENSVRLRYSCSHSKELFWFNEEIPTIGMSLNYTNHLIDLANIHTFINAYSSDREVIKIAIQKLIGNSSFKGKAEETVFCNRRDTRL